MNKFYVVKEGRKKGIYNTWEECKQQVEGYSNACYKSFKTYNEALEYLESKNKNTNIEGLIAYVDGSFNSSSKEYGYGCVIIYGGKVIKTLSGKGNDLNYLSMHNVAGEILGSLKAIEYGIKNKYKMICVYYDYLGIEKWANKEWKANKLGTKQYQDKIALYRKDIDINFIKVLAHSGDQYNEQADKLAKKAVGIK